MSKSIALLYYSQSGQLKEISERFAAPFLQAGHEVEFVQIIPEEDFPFPWSAASFFDAMPESVLGKPVSIKNPNFKKEKYDLIVFAYQPWFLSPSIPATSALHHPEIKKRLHNTDVITLIGSRNMWISAQEKVKILLKEAGANLISCIALTDKHSNLISAITIQYWMFTARKARMMGIFPLPGISKNDIALAEEYGKLVVYKMNSKSWTNLQEELVGLGALNVQTNLMFVESRATMLFKIWANTIVKKKNRALWLQIFKYYLLFALFIVAPMVLFIYTIFIKPFLTTSIEKQKNYHLGLS